MKKLFITEEGLDNAIIMVRNSNVICEKTKDLIENVLLCLVTQKQGDYRIGDVFLIHGDEYVLCHIGDGLVNFISAKTGNIWNSTTGQREEGGAISNLTINNIEPRAKFLRKGKRNV